MSKLPACTMLFAALAVLGVAPAQAQLQGTLFTTPEQRAYLDFLRQEQMARNRDRGFDIDEAFVPQTPGETAAPPPEPVFYRLGGIMSRRDGGHSIWLNGRSLREDELPEEAALMRENGTLALRFDTPQGEVFVRPGQTLNFDAGRVQENYENERAAAAAAPAMPTPETNQEAAVQPGSDTDEASSGTGPERMNELALADEQPPENSPLESLASELGMTSEELQVLLRAMQAAAEATDEEE